MPDLFGNVREVWQAMSASSVDSLGFDGGKVLDRFASWVTEGIANALEYVFEPAFDLISNPISFDFAADLTLGFQGAALAIVFAIVLGRGITKGIVGSATDDDMDVVHYIWRSIVPIGAVIIAPTVAAAVTSAAAKLMGYVVGEAAMENFCSNLAALIFSMASSKVDSLIAPGTTSPMLLIGLLAALAIAWNLCALTLEILKRWIQLAMMSVIIPFTAVTTAIEDSSDIITALKTMAGIVVTIVLQVFLLVSAAGIAGNQESAGAMATLFLFLAVMAAARALPGWIDKFTYASAIGGSGGGASRALIMASRLIPRGGRR